MNKRFFYEEKEVEGREVKERSVVNEEGERVKAA